MKVKRTERGWIGHFCCAAKCLFRRNTLLEYEYIRIVVSTVGLMTNDYSAHEYVKIKGYCYFETMAFHAERVADRYWDADVSRQVRFDSPCSIPEFDADDLANDMHETVVSEITRGLEDGNKY